MTKQRGLTLFELMIGLAILAVVGIIFAVVAVASCGLGGSAEHAEQAARAHAEKLGWKIKGIACTGNDTDWDGYISCTVALEDGTERNLECASGGRVAKGCKTAPLVKRGGGLLEQNDDF